MRSSTSRGQESTGRVEARAAAVRTMGCGASSPNDHGGNAPPSPATRVVQHTPPTTRRTRPPTDAKQGTIEQERPAELASKAHPTDGAPARLSPVPNIRSDLHHVFLTHGMPASRLSRLPRVCHAHTVRMMQQSACQSADASSGDASPLLDSGTFLSRLGALRRAWAQ